MNGYRTIVSAVIAALPALANLLGFEVAPGFSEEATEAVMDVITVGGTIAAIYFRLKATVPGWFAKKPE
jgi:hypothetical protein